MLALDYRPVRLDDLVGQKHISKVLGHLLEKYKSGKMKIPAGFLFSGPRGTGKTSTARILSMALNCENPDGVEPCGECVTCQEIKKGHHSSTLEIDAASNGSVEDIRKLRDFVMHRHDGKYRVIVLDECHSMSREAFNALLKQLEEPPPNVLYILVTTAPERVIQTVISRLMWFEFRPLSAKAIAARLRHVADIEKFNMDDEVCTRIAIHADGGMRDALMITEQLLIADDLNIKGFESLVGTISDELCAKIIRLAGQKDFVVLSEFIEENARGVGVAPLVESITNMLVNLLRVQLGDKGTTLTAELAEEISQLQILGLLKTMWDVRRMRRSPGQDRLTLQLALALMCGDAVPKKTASSTSKKLSGDQLDAMFS